MHLWHDENRLETEQSKRGKPGTTINLNICVLKFNTELQFRYATKRRKLCGRFRWYTKLNLFSCLPLCFLKYGSCWVSCSKRNMDYYSNFVHEILGLEFTWLFYKRNSKLNLLVFFYLNPLANYLFLIQIFLGRFTNRQCIDKERLNNFVLNYSQ